MKKILIIFICLILITGCGTKNNDKELDALKEEISSLKQQLEDQNNNNSSNENTDNSDIDEIKQIVEENNKKLENLKTLEDKVKELQDTNSSLSKKITSLETSNKNLNSTIDSLKNTTSSKPTTQYTITKSQLIGTWKYGKQTITFTDSNCDVIGNLIIYNKDNYYSAAYYMYKDGKLYVTQDGAVLNK